MRPLVSLLWASCPMAGYLRNLGNLGRQIRDLDFRQSESLFDICRDRVDRGRSGHPAALSSGIGANRAALAVEDCHADQHDGEQSRSAACVRRRDHDQPSAYRIPRWDYRNRAWPVRAFRSECAQGSRRLAPKRSIAPFVCSASGGHCVRRFQRRVCRTTCGARAS